jgi:hypothetical protein
MACRCEFPVSSVSPVPRLDGVCVMCVWVLCRPAGGSRWKSQHVPWCSCNCLSLLISKSVSIFHSSLYLSLNDHPSYDHLTEVLLKVAREKPEDALAAFENLSTQVKCGELAPALFKVSLFVTRECVLNCVHCVCVCVCHLARRSPVSAVLCPPAGAPVGGAGRQGALAAAVVY